MAQRQTISLANVQLPSVGSVGACSGFGNRCWRPHLQTHQRIWPASSTIGVSGTCRHPVISSSRSSELRVMFVTTHPRKTVSRRRKAPQ